MWCPAPPAPTAKDAKVQLLQLGALLLRRRPPRPPEVLLREVPPLLRLLKRRSEDLERAGLRRADRVAATQLLVALHDAWQAGAEAAPLQAALEVFCLRAVTLLGPKTSPLRLYRLSCASAQSRSACARR
jgi:hypothetical protein